MTITRSLEFTREDTLPPSEPKELQINGRTFSMIDEMSTIELVLVSASMMQGGAQVLSGLERLFRKTLLPEDFEEFVTYTTEINLTPLELAEVAQTIIEMYTLRPTEPS